MLQIRRAQAQDAAAIIEAQARSILELCAKDYGPEQIRAWSGRRSRPELWCRAMDRDYVWVVEVDSVVRGYGHLALMGPTLGEVLGLYLAPEAQGQGAGLGLLRAIKDRARSAGIETLRLDSTLTAEAFYRAQGFVPVEGKRSVEIGGVDIPCVPMECSLRTGRER